MATVVSVNGLHVLPFALGKSGRDVQSSGGYAQSSAQRVLREFSDHLRELREYSKLWELWPGLPRAMTYLTYLLRNLSIARIPKTSEKFTQIPEAATPCGGFLVTGPNPSDSYKNA